jgi:hypothetical protein
MKRTLWFVGLVACLALLAWPLVSVLRNPLPKGRIVMATGGAAGVYDELAQSYKAELGEYGVELVTRPDIGGFYTLKSLVVDLDGDVTAGIVKGGFVGGQQGRLATEDERNWHKKDVAGMRSLGRLFAEPMWIFTRAGESPASLRGLLPPIIVISSRPCMVALSAHVSCRLRPQSWRCSARHTALHREVTPEKQKADRRRPARRFGWGRRRTAATGDGGRNDGAVTAASSGAP